jgi:hypothetical protein
MAFVPYHGGFAPTAGISDPLESLMRGYKQAQVPAAMRRQAEMEELKRQLLATQNKYLPEEKEAGLNKALLTNRMANLKYQQEPQRFQNEQQEQLFANMLKDAQRRKLEQELTLDPEEQRLGRFTGNPAAAMQMAWIKKNKGENSLEYQMAKGLFEQDAIRQQILNVNRTAQTASLPARLLPKETRAAEIAARGGAGITPIESAASLAKGQTAAEQAAERGVDIEKTNPVYALTAAQAALMATRKGLSAETDYLTAKITPYLSRYSSKFFGYSPEQTMDALTGTNKDYQAGAIAAQAIAPEIMNLRITMSGGRASVTLTQGLVDKSMLKLNQFQGLVTPEVFDEAQKKMQTWLKEGVNIYNSTITENTNITNKPNYKNKNTLTEEDKNPSSAPVENKSSVVHGRKFQNAKQFQDYVRTLTAEQRAALKASAGIKK